MVRLLITLTLALTILSAFAHAGGEAEGPALKGLDPLHLCHGTEKQGLEEFAFVHEGFTYWFASENSMAHFKEYPDRWCIQKGGACAIMPHASGKPDRFEVHGGRIYIFGSEHCRETFLASPETYVEPPRTVAVLVYDRVELLDFAGPTEVFTVAGGGAFEVLIVGPTSEPITSQGVVTVTPTVSFEDAPEIDILVIPGGGIGTIYDHQPLREWIRTTALASEHTMTVCNGAFMMADLGLFDGMEVTTHHDAIEGLRESYPSLTVLEDARVVDNGQFVTTAGVSAGIDGALHMVEKLLGRQAAEQAARYMEYRRERVDADAE